MRKYGATFGFGYVGVLNGVTIEAFAKVRGKIWGQNMGVKGTGQEVEKVRDNIGGAIEAFAKVRGKIWAKIWVRCVKLTAAQ